MILIIKTYLAFFLRISEASVVLHCVVTLKGLRVVLSGMRAFPDQLKED